LGFSGYFPVIYGFSLAIHIRIHHHFSRFFLSVGWWTRTVASGPLLSKFTTLAQTFSYAADFATCKIRKKEDILAFLDVYGDHVRNLVARFQTVGIQYAMTPSFLS